MESIYLSLNSISLPHHPIHSGTWVFILICHKQAGELLTAERQNMKQFKRILNQPYLFLQLRMFIIVLLTLMFAASGSRLLAQPGPGTIRIGGTGGALGTMQQLAKAFKKTHPDVNIVLFPSLGSSGGISAVQEGALDIAISSRPLDDAEHNRGLVAIEYAKTPFVFVISSKSSITGLTTRQAVEIYEGGMQSWPDGSPIRLVMRPERDSDTALLKSMSDAMKNAVRKQDVIFSSGQDTG